MVAGVAAGIADRIGVDRWVIRLAFLVLSFGGGSGILLYIAAWLLMPEEGQAESVGQRWANQANSTRPWIGVVFVLIAAAILFSNFPFFDGGLLFPTALLVIGILLYRGDLPGIDWKPKPRPDKTPNPTSTETHERNDHDHQSPTITQPIAPVGSQTTDPAVSLGPDHNRCDDHRPRAAGRHRPGIAAIDADPRHYFALAVVDPRSRSPGRNLLRQGPMADSDRSAAGAGHGWDFGCRCLRRQLGQPPRSCVPPVSQAWPTTYDEGAGELSST